jgi:hypothetical protein
MPLIPVQYPLDLEGNTARNAIIGEVHLLSNVTQQVFVPSGGPFFGRTMQVVNNSDGHPLVLNVDYELLYTCRNASLACGNEILGVVYITNPLVTSVSITYQVIGGQYSRMVDVLANVIASVPVGGYPYRWRQILNVPAELPPVAHTNTLEDFQNLGDMVQALELHREAIAARKANHLPQLWNYLQTSITQRRIAINTAYNTPASPVSPPTSYGIAITNSVIPPVDGVWTGVVSPALPADYSVYAMLFNPATGVQFNGGLATIAQGSNAWSWQGTTPNPGKTQFQVMYKSPTSTVGVANTAFNIAPPNITITNLTGTTGNLQGTGTTQRALAPGEYLNAQIIGASGSTYTSTQCSTAPDATWQFNIGAIPNGMYTVKVSWYNDLGLLATVSQSITLNSLPPTAITITDKSLLLAGEFWQGTTSYQLLPGDVLDVSYTRLRDNAVFTEPPAVTSGLNWYSNNARDSSDNGDWQYKITWKNSAGTVLTSATSNFTLIAPVITIDDAGTGPTSNNWNGRTNYSNTGTSIVAQILRQSDNAIISAPAVTQGGADGTWSTVSVNPGYGDWIFSVTWKNSAGTVLATQATNYTLAAPVNNYAIGSISNIRVYSNPGTYQVAVQPGERIAISLFGAGGGGAAPSISSANDGSFAAETHAYAGGSTTVSGTYINGVAAGGNPGTAVFSPSYGYTVFGLDILTGTLSPGQPAIYPGQTDITAGYKVADGLGSAGLIGYTNLSNGNTEATGGAGAIGWAPDVGTGTWGMSATDNGYSVQTTSATSGAAFNGSAQGTSSTALTGGVPTQYGLPAPNQPYGCSLPLHSNGGGGGGEQYTDYNGTPYYQRLPTGGAGGNHMLYDYTNITNAAITLTITIGVGGAGAPGPGGGYQLAGSAGSNGLAVVANTSGNLPGIYVTGANPLAGQFNGFVAGGWFSNFTYRVLNQATRGVVVDWTAISPGADNYVWAINFGTLPAGQTYDIEMRYIVPYIDYGFGSQGSYYQYANKYTFIL